MDLQKYLEENVYVVLGYKPDPGERIASSAHVGESKYFVITTRGTTFGWDENGCWAVPIRQRLNPGHMIGIWDTMDWSAEDANDKWIKVVQCVTRMVYERDESNSFSVAITLMLTVFVAASVIVAVRE
jgi:hypothetical protein